MIQLREMLTCIHCWSEFPSSEILWQSEHEDLKRGDLLLKDKPIRFLPSRFNSRGNAIDAMGDECHLLACPRCHLTIPRALIEREVIFVSILGSPQSGKSYYLAALINRMKSRFPEYFGYNVNDTDLNSNALLNRYEKELFLRADANELFVLGKLIPKTQLGGMLYNAVSHGNQVVHYPKPFSYNFDACGLKNSHSSNKPKTMLCVYDNAGEHFKPGQDSNQDPGTRHMARADFLLFIYDPTQDSRWKNEVSNEAQTKHFSSNTSFQEHILLEAANRIRSLNGIPDGEPIDKPLFVVVCKLDVWMESLPKIDWSTPLSSRGDKTCLDVAEFLNQSSCMRQKLASIIPSIVNAADSVSQSVYFVPVSALGSSPQHFTDEGFPLFRSADIRPKRVELPMIAGLAFSGSGLIKTAK